MLLSSKPFLLRSRSSSQTRARAPLRRSAARAASSNGNGSVPSFQAEATGPDYSALQRNLALELVRVTEAAALASGRWFGKGDKYKADLAAVEIMRYVLNSIDFSATVIIGEGEKDESAMLFNGEVVGNGGNGSGDMEIAVDPLDGTSLIAAGRNGAVSVIALAEEGALFDPGPSFYMEKLVTGPQVNPHMVSLNYSWERNIKAVAEALGKPVSDVTAVILDRPRHAEIIGAVREAGARIRLISDGDVSAAIEVAKEGAPADLLIGIGGTPEGVIAAAALRCMGGSIQGRLWPRNEEEKAAAEAAGYDMSRILYTNDLCSGEQIFFAATGVSEGDLLKGVRFYNGGAATHSIVMRASSGTVREVFTQHKWGLPSITNPQGLANTAVAAPRF